MVISKIVGGLGNQMFQYAIAKAIAKKNNTPFYLDIKAFITYELFEYKLGDFNIENHVASSKQIRSFDGDTSIHTKVKRKLGLSKYFYKEKKRHIFDNKVFKYKDIYLSGYWQNEAYFSEIKSELRKDFQPIIEMPMYTKELYQNILDCNAISVHIRRGDYISHPEIGLVNLEYYKESIKIMDSKISKATYYIFSNDIGWCKENFSFLENSHFIDSTLSEVEDFFLMTACKHHIVANSTFSWWPAWLNEYKKQVVIAPKRWRVDTINSSSWLPSRWIRV